MPYPTPPFQPQVQAPGPPNPQNPNNSCARLMALLSAPPSMGNIPPQSTAQAAQIYPTYSAGSDFAVPQNANILPLGPGLANSHQGDVKLPKGRHLIGDNLVYDIDARLPGEVQPQLEVTPITKYVSDPGLVLGRQIAVNMTYICYGLRRGAIRVLNINTALRSLFKGLAQRVTDMAFFAEDVHILASASMDGRVYVWKITECPDEEDKPQITGRLVSAIQVTGEWESVHPRICWHCHKQEVLVVGIGRLVVKIDTTKVGKGEKFSAEEPLNCPTDKLINGIQLIGSHDGEVSDLSMCQWMTTRLVSASVDGTIKIWDDRKSLPIAVLRPNDGQPVHSVTFLAAPHRPDHIILITGGALNHEMKIWISASEEGWLLPSDAESWHCTQTLVLKSSEGRLEEAFFNQVVALPQAGLLVLANAKRNAIYAVHLEYGPNPAATRFDYIAEFTVTMPILSFTGTSELLPHGEQIVQVYCVQTQAIQQYALDLSQCLPSPMENVPYEKSDSHVSHDASSRERFTGAELSGNKPADISVSSSAPITYVHESGLEKTPKVRHPVTATSADSTTVQEFAPSGMDSKAVGLTTAANESDASFSPAITLPLSPRVSRSLSGIRTASSSFEHVPVNERTADQKIAEYSVDRQIDSNHANLSDVASLDDNSRNDDSKLSQDDISMPLNHPIKFKHPTHLVTPAEILMASSPSDVNHLNEPPSEGEISIPDVIISNDTKNVEVEVKTVVETRFDQNDNIGPSEHQIFENKEKSFCSQASGLGMEMARECRTLSSETYIVEETRQFSESGGTEANIQPSTIVEVHESSKDVIGKVVDSSTSMPAQHPEPSTKGKKQKEKSVPGSGLSSRSCSNSNLADYLGEPGISSKTTPVETAESQILSMQETLNQVMIMQKELQKQMAVMVAVPITKEGKRLETALGRSMEKAVKANSDALGAQLQEENVKQEKAARDDMQQLTQMFKNCLNKDLPTILEKTVKRELSTIEQSVTRTISPTIEKTISNSIVESFQKGVGDKALNQLEKSVRSKLEATVSKHIQAQFQTSGKQALQDALNSATSITQTLGSELLDGQRKLLALAVSGADSNAPNPLISQLSNGPLGILHEKLEVPPDPTTELSRLVAERKYEEAFNAALQRTDVTLLSRLCSQYALDLSQRLPSPMENVPYEKSDSSVSQDAASGEASKDKNVKLTPPRQVSYDTPKKGTLILWDRISDSEFRMSVESRSSEPIEVDKEEVYILNDDTSRKYFEFSNGVATLSGSAGRGHAMFNHIEQTLTAQEKIPTMSNIMDEGVEYLRTTPILPRHSKIVVNIIGWNTSTQKFDLYAFGDKYLNKPKFKDGRKLIVDAVSGSGRGSILGIPNLILKLKSTQDSRKESLIKVMLDTCLQDLYFGGSLRVYHFLDGKYTYDKMNILDVLCERKDYENLVFTNQHFFIIINPGDQRILNFSSITKFATCVFPGLKPNADMISCINRTPRILIYLMKLPTHNQQKTMIKHLKGVRRGENLPGIFEFVHSNKTTCSFLLTQAEKSTLSRAKKARSILDLW